MEQAIEDRLQDSINELFRINRRFRKIINYIETHNMERVSRSTLRKIHKAICENTIDHELAAMEHEYLNRRMDNIE